MKKQIHSCILAGALLVSACDAVKDNPGQTLGAIVGAGVGIAVGAQIGDGTGQKVAAVLGGAAGAWFGSVLGRTLDEKDRELAEASAHDALENGETGETRAWSNPDTGHSGTVRPVSDRTVEAADNRECRDFESTVVVDGKTETGMGRACRQPDGSWLIVQ